MVFKKGNYVKINEYGKILTGQVYEVYSGSPLINIKLDDGGYFFIDPTSNDKDVTVEFDKVRSIGSVLDNL